MTQNDQEILTDCVKILHELTDVVLKLSDACDDVENKYVIDDVVAEFSQQAHNLRKYLEQNVKD